MDHYHHLYMMSRKKAKQSMKKAENSSNDTFAVVLHKVYHNNLRKNTKSLIVKHNHHQTSKCKKLTMLPKNQNDLFNLSNVKKINLIKNKKKKHRIKNKCFSLLYLIIAIIFFQNLFPVNASDLRKHLVDKLKEIHSGQEPKETSKESNESSKESNESSKKSTQDTDNDKLQNINIIFEKELVDSKKRKKWDDLKKYNGQTKTLEKIFGKECTYWYLTDDELPSGGYSENYRGIRFNNSIIEEVAIKEIPNSQIQNTGMNEVKFIKELQGNENIIELKAIIRQEYSTYIITELCKNDLHLEIYPLVLLHTPVNEDKIKKYLKQIIGGVSHMHAKQIIHRDLKPENILVTSDDNLKIIDFGASYHLEKKEGNTTGYTKSYIAPEQQRVDGNGDLMTLGTEKTDVWAIGCIMYSLVFRRPPQTPENLQTVTQIHKYIEQNFPSSLPVSMKNLLKKMLEENPEERIALANILNEPLFTIEITDIVQFKAEYKPKNISNPDPQQEYVVVKITDTAIFLTEPLKNNIEELENMDYVYIEIPKSEQSHIKIKKKNK